MKKFFLQYTEAFLFFSAFSVILFSCNKKELLVDAPYPDQKIGISQAAVATVGPGANGVYTITGNVEAVAHRYSIDSTGTKFNIPLGIIRSGVNAKDAYTLNISANTDTVNKFILAGKFVVATDPLVTTEVLPTSAYTLPSSVELADGSFNQSFTLAINLNFLTNSLAATPKKRYAIGISLSNSKSSIINPTLATTVIFIDPQQVLVPASVFGSYVEIKTATFLNASLNAASYSWNFGDGSAISSAVAPSHIYAASGTYPVTLTTIGIPGSGIAAVKTTNIVIP